MDTTRDSIERGPGARARRRAVIAAWAGLATAYGVALPSEDDGRG